MQSETGGDDQGRCLVVGLDQAGHSASDSPLVLTHKTHQQLKANAHSLAGHILASILLYVSVVHCPLALWRCENKKVESKRAKLQDERETKRRQRMYQKEEKTKQNRKRDARIETRTEGERDLKRDNDCCHFRFNYFEAAAAAQALEAMSNRRELGQRRRIVFALCISCSRWPQLGTSQTLHDKHSCVCECCFRPPLLSVTRCC